MVPALEFLRITAKKKFASLYIHINAMMSVVLNVLFHWGTDELVEQQLAAMDKWVVTHPAVESLRVEYQEKLQRRKAAKGAEQGGDVQVKIEKEK